MIGGVVRVGLAVLVLVAAVGGCSRAVAGVAAPAPGAAPVAAAPAGPGPAGDPGDLESILGGPGSPAPGVECPLVGIAQVGMTLRTDVRGGFPRQGATPARRSCEFGIGPAGQDSSLRIVADGRAGTDQIALIGRHFADGQRFVVAGAPAFYRTTGGAGAELAVLGPRGAVGLIVTAEPGAAGPGDVKAELVQLAQRALDGG